MLRTPPTPHPSSDRRGGCKGGRRLDFPGPPRKDLASKAPVQNSSTTRATRGGSYGDSIGRAEVKTKEPKIESA